MAGGAYEINAVSVIQTVDNTYYLDMICAHLTYLEIRNSASAARHAEVHWSTCGWTALCKCKRSLSWLYCKCWAWSQQANKETRSEGNHDDVCFDLILETIIDESNDIRRLFIQTQTPGMFYTIQHHLHQQQQQPSRLHLPWIDKHEDIVVSINAKRGWDALPPFSFLNQEDNEKIFSCIPVQYFLM